jgi:hypothetical protein
MLTYADDVHAHTNMAALRSHFKNTEHGKYKADVYFQTDTLTPMVLVHETLRY